MKTHFLNCSLALTLSLLVFSLAPAAVAQHSDQDRTPAAPQKTNPATIPQGEQSEAQMPASGDTQANNSKTFSGRIVQEDGRMVLKDPVTKVSYKLDDEKKAKQYVGRQVKVTGKMDSNTNTMRLDRIDPL